MDQVVIIESDSVFSETFAPDLESIGLRAISFTSEEDYFNSKFRDHLGVIIINLNSTHLAFELTKKIRERNQGAPIVIISDDQSEGRELEALDVEADTYLRKPFRHSFLKFIVRNHRRKTLAIIKECLTTSSEFS